MTEYVTGQNYGWKGGECPVHPETVVRVWFRYGGSAWGCSRDWVWTHGDNDATDIVCFKVFTPYVEPKERPNRKTFDAMCAMRNAINEYVPMPSIESDLLQGPENSVFCATVAEAVIVEIRRLLDLQANSKAPPMTIREAALQARIEELVKERDYIEGTNDTLIALNQALEAKLAKALDEREQALNSCEKTLDERDEALAKLTKAVEALQKIADGSSDNSEKEAKRVLAELEGQP